MPPSTLPNPLALLLPAEPLTKGAFAPFGDVIENPLPDVRPSPSLPASLLASASAVPANQGTAIKYQHVSAPADLYRQSPSGSSRPVASIFSCAARALEPSPAPAPAPISTLLPYANASHRGGRFRVEILERHPFTTQTFVPLGASSSSYSYLVIVAPTSPAPSPATDALPSPARGGKGPGLPALERLRAFVASPGQAVTYAAGTWHAPMVALGPPGAAVDFVVSQFASGVAEEDCQEVVIEAAAEGAGVVVQVPDRAPVAKL